MSNKYNSSNLLKIISSLSIIIGTILIIMWIPNAIITTIGFAFANATSLPKNVSGNTALIYTNLLGIIISGVSFLISGILSKKDTFLKGQTIFAILILLSYSLFPLDEIWHFIKGYSFASINSFFARATTKDGGKIAEASITVTPIYPTAVKLNKTKISLAKGKTFQLKATLVPSTTDFKTVIWESSDESIARVVNGKITAGQTPGECVITATSTIDNTKLARCTVTVLPQKVTSVKFANVLATQYVGAFLDLRVKLTVGPANADNKTVKWSSSNTKVAIVDENSGEVTFIAGGKVTIKATAQDGSKKSASKSFTVKQYVSTINLNATEITLAKGKTFTLKATVLPGTASNKAVTWTSSNSKVATVSSSGIVKGIAASSEPITITCRAKDGSGIIAQCIVYVDMDGV